MDQEMSTAQRSGMELLSFIRAAISDALGYWEPRRWLYNGMLTVVVVSYFFALWPGSQTVFCLGGMAALFIMAVLANVAYCAAYLPDLALQLSNYRHHLPNVRRALLVIGILFAAALTRQFLITGFAPLP